MPTHDVARIGTHHAWIPSAEVLSAANSIFWAVLSILTPDPISDRNALRFMAHLAPDSFWEMAFLGLGVTQLIGVFFNVRPMRFLAAFLLTIFYSMMVQSYISLGQQALPSISPIIIMCVGTNLSATLAYAVYTVWAVQATLDRAG